MGNCIGKQSKKTSKIDKKAIQETISEVEVGIEKNESPKENSPIINNASISISSQAEISRAVNGQNSKKVTPAVVEDEVFNNKDLEGIKIENPESTAQPTLSLTEIAAQAHLKLMMNDMVDDCPMPKKRTSIIQSKELLESDEEKL